MKQSKRLLVSTILGIYALLFLYVGASRAINGVDPREPGAPLRTTAEELAALRDFDEIDMETDLSVEVVQQSEFTIEVTGMAADGGDLLVRVESGVLRLRGYRNADGAVVRIGMPELRDFTTGFSPRVSITGFSGDELDIRAGTRPGSLQSIVLRDNDVTDLQVRIFATTADVEVQIDRATFANGVDILGGARVTITD